MRTILSFCQGFVEKAFDRGDVLLVEGEKEGILYILIEGSLEVLKGDLQINVVSEPGHSLAKSRSYLISRTRRPSKHSRRLGCMWSSVPMSSSSHIQISRTRLPSSLPSDYTGSQAISLT